MKSGVMMTSERRFTYEMKEGVLSGFVDVNHTTIKTGTIDLDSEFTYTHTLEWKDI